MAKYQDIAELLKKEILEGKYTSDGKIPTEHELSSRFGVSRQTIRQAIGCLKNDGYLYQVQGSGTYIAKPEQKRNSKAKSIRNVMVICTYISDYIFPSIIRGVEKVLSSEGVIVNLVATRNRVDLERKILQKIIEGQDVDGIIVEGTKTGFPNPNVPLYRTIHEMGIPVIFLHCSYPELADAVVVGMNDLEGGKKTVKALIGMGCQKFGAIFKSDDRQGLLRYAGFCDGLIESSLSLDAAKVRWFTTEDIVASNSLMNYDIYKEFEDTDALICYNDQVATAAIRVYEHAEMELPRIFSFDNSQLCSAYPGKIISLGHRKDALGEEAAHKIINMMNGEKETSELMDWILP